MRLHISSCVSAFLGESLLVILSIFLIIVSLARAESVADGPPRWFTAGLFHDERMVAHGMRGKSPR